MSPRKLSGYFRYIGIRINGFSTPWPVSSPRWSRNPATRVGQPAHTRSGAGGGRLPPRIARLDRCKVSDSRLPTQSQGSAMDIPSYKTALIVGAGEGLSASLARRFAKEKIKVALAARKVEKLGALCSETGARAFACDATNADEVERLFGLVERELGAPDLVVYNASGRARGAFVDLVPAEVAQAMT